MHSTLFHVEKFLFTLWKLLSRQCVNNHMESFHQFRGYTSVHPSMHTFKLTESFCDKDRIEHFVWTCYRLYLKTLTSYCKGSHSMRPIFLIPHTISEITSLSKCSHALTDSFFLHKFIESTEFLFLIFKPIQFRAWKNLNKPIDDNLLCKHEEIGIFDVLHSRSQNDLPSQ